LSLPFDLLAEVKKSRLRFKPMSGEKLQALITSAFDLSDELKAQAKEAAKIGKLNKRTIVLECFRAKLNHLTGMILPQG